MRTTGRRVTVMPPCESISDMQSCAASDKFVILSFDRLGAGHLADIFTLWAATIDHSKDTKVVLKWNAIVLRWTFSWARRKNASGYSWFCSLTERGRSLELGAIERSTSCTQDTVLDFFNSIASLVMSSQIALHGRQCRVGYRDKQDVLHQQGAGPVSLIRLDGCMVLHLGFYIQCVRGSMFTLEMSHRQEVCK